MTLDSPAGDGRPKVLLYQRLSEVEEMEALLGEHRIGLTIGYPELPSGIRMPPLSEDELIRLAQGHVALCGASRTHISRRVIESLPELRYISKVGIGFEVIDVDAATQHGIMVTTTPVPTEVAIVAEHTMAMMLALMKHLWHYNAEQISKGYWSDANFPMWSLKDRVVGIVGLGRIGSSVAEHLKHFGAKVIANDVRDVHVDGVEMVSLEELMRRSDAVTIHVAADNPSTHGLISAELIASMKPTAVIVNTSRGVVIDQPALVDALRERRIWAAALDVFWGEPPEPSDPVFTLPNLIATPHAAAHWPVASRDMGIQAAVNLVEMIEGQVPRYLLNTDVLKVLGRA